MRDLKDVEKALVNEDLNQAKNICIDYAKIMQRYATAVDE